jgi:uncharacterized protein
MWSHRPSFSIALFGASRLVQLYGRLTRSLPTPQLEAPNVSVSRQAIPSGDSLLDAIYVEPTAPARASVLICHGVGEIVTQWFPIQRIFADAGVSSLVFDYSGYGRSTGRIHWGQFEQDATSAFRLLKRLAGFGPASLLGFSLGTGIVSAIAPSVKADRVVLCAGFTSFRAAARALGIPAFLSPFVPPIWNAQESLLHCRMPVLIVHSTADTLFPVQMARDIVSWCGGDAELLLVDGIGHNEPFYRPDISYWGRIIERIGG